MIDLKDPQFYANWSEEDLQAHINKLREVLDRKRGNPPLPSKDKVARFFDPNSSNFLGTGLPLKDFEKAMRIQAIENNLVYQPLEERRRRMGLIIEMAVELKKIQEQTRFATMTVQMVIEDVIKGDWASVRMLGESVQFKDEHPSLQEQYGPIYAHFSELCQQAFDTRPGAEEVATESKN